MGAIASTALVVALAGAACWTPPEPDPLVASPGPGCWMLEGENLDGTPATYAFEIGRDGGTSLSARGGRVEDPRPTWTDPELDVLLRIASPMGASQHAAVETALGREVTELQAREHLAALRTRLLASPPCP